MLNQKMTFILEITPEEFRLISNALQNKLRTEQLQQDALDLQTRLFKARNAAVKSQLDNIAKHLENES